MSSDPPLHVALGPDLRRPSVRLLKVIRDEFLVAELRSTSENDWSVSQNKRFRASIIHYRLGNA